MSPVACCLRRWFIGMALALALGVAANASAAADERIGLMSAVEPLRVANRFRGELYRWRLLSLDGGPVSGSNGMSLNVDGGLEEFDWQRNFLVKSAQASEAYHPTRNTWGPLVVPPKSYFVLGDNRDISSDSRYWGFLPQSYVKGKALMIYWSYESGPGEYVDEGLGATVKRVVSVVTHFFTRTRWERILRQIH